MMKTTGRRRKRPEFSRIVGITKVCKIGIKRGSLRGGNENKSGGEVDWMLVVESKVGEERWPFIEGLSSHSRASKLRHCKISDPSKTLVYLKVFPVFYKPCSAVSLNHDKISNQTEQTRREWYSDCFIHLKDRFGMDLDGRPVSVGWSAGAELPVA